MALVFFGTLDQVNFGIHETQKRYFESFIVIWNPLPPFSDSPWARIGLPLPGGYLLGPLLLVNLIAAQAFRFKWSWKKSGIFLIHIGLVLLIVSEFITDLFAEERQLWLDEGATKNWSETYLENEIVLIDRTDPSKETVYAIDADHLRAGDVIDSDRLPLRLEIMEYFPNSRILRVGPNETFTPQASNGVAATQAIRAIPARETFQDDEINTDTAIVRVLADNRDLGTWMVSNIFESNFPDQTFEVDGRTYAIELRFKRTYYPFSLTLLDFTHERYPGTEIPKDFSSRVIVTDPAEGVERETLIYMNHPLRYAGHTFYQSGFRNEDTSSMLQVVRNPGWTLPYISVTLVGLGLTIQFTMGMLRSKAFRNRGKEVAA